jgi:hypothetical protein
VLAFKCLADDDLVGSQLCPGTPTSLPQDQVLINSLSLHSSFQVSQAQNAVRGYKVTIQVLRESQIDMPMEEVKDYVPSPPPMELAQPPKAGTNYEPASKTSQPQDEPDQEFDDTQQSRVRNDQEQEPCPWSDVNVDYKPLLLEGQCADVILVPTISELKMSNDPQLAGYVISSVLEPQKDDDSEPEGSLTGSITAKDSAASSLQVTKGPASKGQPTTADCRSGWPWVDIRACMQQGSQATQEPSGTSLRTKRF